MILVTGGAGYIGSQIVKQLVQQNEKLVVVDNLSTSLKANVRDCELIEGDIGDPTILAYLFNHYRIDEVIHLAASTVVSESVVNPAKFYNNNTSNTAKLLAKCAEHHIKNFIFSSTAAVYGNVTNLPVVEETLCQPINPYGHSKLMSEIIIKDIAAASTMKQVTLRYFNVAGADPSNKLGPSLQHSTLLIRMAVQTALGIHSHLNIYGNDYDTVDGTGVRDYIHVIDIAKAHLNALTYLRSGGSSTVLNCGYGRGYSVLEVVKAVEKITAQKLPVQYLPRRAGDPASVIASADKIKKILVWQPQYNNLDKIVTDSYYWEKQLLQQ